MATKLCFQNEQVKGSVYSLCKGPVVGGNKKDTGPERRWLKGRRLWGGGWRCGWGQSTWDLEGHLEEVRNFPKTCRMPLKGVVPYHYFVYSRIYI